MNVAFAGGGTGGHIFPIKTLIEYVFQNKELNKKINKIYWVGEKTSLEEKICSNIKQDKLSFISIFSGKFRREKSFRSFFLNILDLFKFTYGIIQSIIIIKKHSIDKVFCKGGYVALPIVVAAYICRKEVLLHESDTVPGLANRVASKFAKVKFVGFPNVLSNSIYTGQILSDEIINFKKIELGLDIEGKTNVLVTGGSQGSKFIYDKLLNYLEDNDTLNFNFFIILGIKNLSFKDSFSKFPNVKVFNFLTQKEMGYLYSICDLGISRGSATLLAEQKLRNMKLIIIPLPWTGGNHQYYNGLFYEKEYNDTLIKQNSSFFLNDILSNYYGYKKSSGTTLNTENSKKLIFKYLI